MIDRVDPDIFRRRYFSRCMECTFCHDACCQHGAQVDLDNVEGLLRHADGLEAHLGLPRTEWFQSEIQEDADFPGGRVRRTQVVRGACAFLNRGGRGCGIHSFCIERGLDYHQLKPSVCSMFPITVDAGLLRPSFEVLENELICLGEGPTLYRSQRGELLHDFGAGLLGELDELERGAAA